MAKLMFTPASAACAKAFTLLEMLLAVVVIAVVGISISSAIGGVASQTFSLERRTMAHWLGQNQLHRLRLSQRATQDPDEDFSEISSRPGVDKPWPEGNTTTRVLMGERDWEVHTEISATAHPNVRRIEVEVYEMQRGKRIGPLEHHVAFAGTVADDKIRGY